MTAGDIALVITAIAALITAVAGLIGAVQRRRVQDAEAVEKERNRLRRYAERLLLHIHAVHLLLAEQGIEAPDVPDEAETEIVT